MVELGNVLIVGGGVAGMALAIALDRTGIAAEVVEITPQWTTLGTGISLQGPALRALRAIGLLDDCVRAGFGYSHFNACDAEGRIRGTVALPRLNGPDYPATIGVMRPTLHAVLQHKIAATRVGVRTGTTVASLWQDDSGVVVLFDDGSRGRYGLVVGADGANSRMRELVFGNDCGPQYTGQAVWRATVRRPGEVEARCSYFGAHAKAGLNPVSREAMYIYFVETQPEFVRIEDECLPAVLRERLVEFGGFVAAAREEIRRPEQITYRPIRSHVMPPPWHRNRVVLIGDAAHTTTPHMASGAGIALEDAVVLAEILGAEPGLPRALEAFVARRYARCRMVVQNSRRLGEWEKYPDAPHADVVGLMARTLEAMAQSI
jgi:2-polyprenyl-6-methoxyphenol hydroxylase-like FAD-dependent oxidoreductase